MKRRADGRLVAKVAIGNGKSKFVYAKTKKELDRKVTELKIKLGKGIDVQADKESLQTWCDRWLRLKKPTISKSRYLSYKTAIQKLESLSDIPIAQVRVIDLQEIIIDMFANNYAANTIKNVKSVATQVFDLAVANRAIEYNPAASVKVPSGAISNTKRPLTEEEQEWITSDSQKQGHIAAMLMLYAGLRRGEMIALTWNDVDFDNQIISVNKSVYFDNGYAVLKTGGKTVNATREVYIPQILVDFLKALPKKSGLICSDSNNQLLSEYEYKKMWKEYQTELNYKYGKFDGQVYVNKKSKTIVLKNADDKCDPKNLPMVIPNITAHMLRHTFVTNMYLAGVDVLTAKEQAGHSDVQTTLGIYTHLNEVYKKKEITKLNNFYAAK